MFYAIILLPFDEWEVVMQTNKYSEKIKDK